MFTPHRGVNQFKESAMPMEHGGDLMKALVAKLYATITGDDDAIKIPRNKYVSWFRPGVPFAPADFRYCATGFTGNTVEEVKNAYHQAFVLSSLFDQIPDTSNGFVGPELQQSIFAGTGDRISAVYNDVLKYSRVVDRPLSDQEAAKLKKFRDLLSVEVEETNLVTDEKTIVSRPGKLTLAYTQKMDEYLSIADELVNMKVEALAATGDDAESRRRVYNYNEKAKFVRKRLEAAEMAWVAQGYRHEYEQINAYISQVTEKSLVLYKQDLRRKFDAALTSSVVDGGSDFYYTTLLPGNFATSPGWTQFTFNQWDAETHHKGETTGWGGSADLNFGLFSIGAKADGGKAQNRDDQSQANFSASFELTQIPICRTGVDMGFFSMRSWTLDDNWNLSYDNRPVSDGTAEGNTGRLAAYATSALFVRNVRLTSSVWSHHADFMNSTVGGGGSIGYGPFRVGGSYSHNTTAGNTSYHLEGDTLVIDGMQLVGTVNNIIPRSPNPLPGLEPGDFVGGA
jgi:hypothetical protein